MFDLLSLIFALFVRVAVKLLIRKLTQMIWFSNLFLRFFLLKNYFIRRFYSFFVKPFLFSLRLHLFSEWHCFFEEIVSMYLTITAINWLYFVVIISILCFFLVYLRFSSFNFIIDQLSQSVRLSLSFS